MRKLLPLLAVILLASCTEIVTVRPPPPNVRAYNSAWEIVAEDYAVGSRSAAPADLAAYVEDYNQTHTDDQLFLVEGEEIVPVEEAPLANAWIVAPSDHAVLAEYLDIERASLSTERELWRIETYGYAGVLYVDRIPPAPEPPVVLPDYERFALYLVALDGSIIFEEHCEDYTPATGYATKELYFEARRYSYNAEAYGRADGSYVVAGRLYIPPEVTP